MKKNILILIILVFLLKIDNISAVTSCKYSTISRQNKLINNINIYYNYHMNGNQPYFDITITNITPDVYFIDLLYDRQYTYQNTNNGEIVLYNYDGQPGSFKFYSADKDCYGTFLGTKYYRFPIYNIYYTDSACSDIPEFEMCNKWVNKLFTYSEFSNSVKEYKSNLNKPQEKEEKVEYKHSFLSTIIKFYTNYYYYFLGVVIIICTIIIIIKRKKDKII